MPRPRTISILLLLALPALAGACGERPRASEAANPPAAQHRFDAATVRPGLEVGDFRVAAADIAPALDHGVYVGSVRFDGDAVVSGTPTRLDSEGGLLCFFVAPESEATLPRMRHDDRRVWFCFDNQEEAGAALEPFLQHEVAVRIDDYRTVYQFTDAFDTARFLGRLAQVPS